MIWGRYSWFPKATGFRADYCRFCEDGVLAVRVRTLDVLHVYWIPVLPYGLWSRWGCSVCDRHPHAAPRTRKGFKIAGAVVLAIFAATVWLPELEQEWGTTGASVARALAIVAFLACLGWIRADRPEASPWKEQRAEVRPLETSRCPLCNNFLAGTDPVACLGCGAKHLPLKLSRDDSSKATVLAAKPHAAAPNPPTLTVGESTPRYRQDPADRYRR